MNSLGNTFTSPSKPKHTSSVNPFARALAETEKQSPGFPPQADTSNPFSDALTRTGGHFPDDTNPYAADSAANTSTQPDWEQQQAEAEAQRKRELMRQRLHQQVNPVETDIFSAREKKVKEEIDKLRQELKMLATDVAKFDKEVEVTLMSEVSQPGQEGKYYISFFQQLRSFIMLLRQKIKSARTWATQLHSKKKKRKGAPGMVIGGQTHEQTSTIQDMMHHERTSAYSGG